MDGMDTREAITTLQHVYPKSPAFSEAVDLAIAALRAQAEAEGNEPLAESQLRELPVREWLWVEIIGGHFRKAKSAYYQAYADYSDGEALCCGYPGLSFEFEYVDYGKTWLAYRYKPEECGK